MLHPRFLLPLILLLRSPSLQAQQAPAPTTSPEPLVAPFDLTWGQDPEQVVTWAKKSNLTMKWIEGPGDPATLLEIDNGKTIQMPNAEFNRLRFRFIAGHLVEATIIYVREDTQAKNRALGDKLTEEIKAKWKNGIESAESTGNNDRSTTITWKVAEGRFIMFNTTQSTPDAAGNQLWIGKVVYRHHALALLAAQKN